MTDNSHIPEEKLTADEAATLWVNQVEALVAKADDCLHINAMTMDGVAAAASQLLVLRWRYAAGV